MIKKNYFDSNKKKKKNKRLNNRFRNKLNFKKKFKKVQANQSTMKRKRKMIQFLARIHHLKHLRATFKNLKLIHQSFLKRKFQLSQLKILKNLTSYQIQHFLIKILKFSFNILRRMIFYFQVFKKIQTVYRIWKNCLNFNQI